ncbi:MAG: hypothetical protein NTY65_07115 [Planctomycetota bacterium]|nr:hypothetical protein [Planctomycetota bacterium]
MRLATLVMILTAGLAAGGCSMWAPTRGAGPVAGPSAADPAPAMEGAYLQKASVAKDVETPLPTAIESTLVLQDKYARALEDLRREQDRFRELTAQKQQLVDEANRLKADLAKTQQELGEANGLLVQMRQEIEKWKEDVLGFRDELRQSNRVQLEALAKVMTLLGGETAPAAAAPPAAAKPASSAGLSTPAVKPAAVAAASSAARAVPAAAAAGLTRSGEVVPAKPAPAPATAPQPVSTGGGKESARANGH